MFNASLANTSTTITTQPRRTVGQGILPVSSPTAATLPEASAELHRTILRAGESWPDCPEVCGALKDLLKISADFRQKLQAETGLSFAESPPAYPQKIEDLLDSAHLNLDESRNTLKATLLELTAAPPQEVFTSGQIIIDALQGMALNILLESGLKLSGMSREAAQTVLPMIKLVRDSLAVVNEKQGSLADRLQAITGKLNAAQVALKTASPDSTACRWVNILCDVVDVLSHGIRTGSLQDSLAKMQNIQPLSAIGENVLSLLKQAEIFQQWQEGRLTDDALAINVLENVAPQQFTLLLSIARKVKDAAGKHGALAAISHELPSWPKEKSAIAALRWMLAAIQSPALRERLEASDGQWLRNELKLDAQEAALMQQGLLKHTRQLASFPFKGSLAEQFRALTQMPELANLFGQMDISINDKIPHLGPLLKDGLQLSDLQGVAAASGTWQMTRELAKLADSKKVGYAAAESLLGGSLAALKKFGGAVYDIAQAFSLPAKKAYGFYKSEYAPGSTTSINTFYRGLIHYISDDYKTNPSDYTLETLNTLSAMLSGTLKCTNGLRALMGKNTAELLEEYTRSDPAKFSRLEHTLIHAVLDTRLAFEIRDALQKEDYVQAKKLLIPLRRVLESCAGDHLFLRRMACLVEALPALCDIHQELKDIQTPRSELLGKLKLRKKVLAATPERRHTLPSLKLLHKELTHLQQKTGIQLTATQRLQTDLDVMRAAVARLGQGELRHRLESELATLEPGLTSLKAAAARQDGDVAELLQTQQLLHKTTRRTLMKEEVSANKLELAHLEHMEKMLNEVPEKLSLPSLSSFTSLSSLPTLAMDFMALLLSSKKPGLQAARAQLETLVTNSASDFITDGVHWMTDKTKQLFTKEVELTPEEKAQGWFVIERDFSTGQLLAGGAAGAASGALLSSVFLLLSAQGVPGLQRGDSSIRSVTMRRTATDINEETGPQTVLLTPSHADIYKTTTEPVTGAGVAWKKWLLMALPVAAGAATGAAIAAAVKPAIREKRDENGLPNCMAALSGPGQLNVVTGEDGVSKGIIQQEDGQSSRVRRGPYISAMIEETVEAENTRFEEEANRIKAEQERIEAIRNNWTETQITNRLNQEIKQLKTATIIMSGSIFDPLAYIDQYIFDSINDYATEGVMLTPDTVITMNRNNGGSFHSANEYVTLRDIVTGKFDYRGNNYIPKFPAGTPQGLINKLMPNATAATTESFFVSGVMDKFNEDIAKLENSPYFMKGAEDFCHLSFKATAKGLLQQADILPQLKVVLENYVSGEINAHQLSFRGEPLAGVTALRFGDDILAWNIYGEYKQFKDSELFNGDKTIQQWIVNHLNLQSQSLYNESDEIRNNAFKSFISLTKSLGPMTKTMFYASALELQSTTNLGKQTITNIINNMKINMDKLVKTQAESTFDNLLTLMGNVATVGLVFVPAYPIVAMVAKMLLSAGITWTKGLLLANNADSHTESQQILSGAMKDILQGTMLDGIPIGLKAASNFLSKAKPFLRKAEDVSANIIDKNAIYSTLETKSNTNGKDNKGSDNKNTIPFIRFNFEGNYAEAYDPATKKYKSLAETHPASTTQAGPATVESPHMQALKKLFILVNDKLNNSTLAPSAKIAVIRLQREAGLIDALTAARLSKAKTYQSFLEPATRIDSRDKIKHIPSGARLAFVSEHNSSMQHIMLHLENGSAVGTNNVILGNATGWRKFNLSELNWFVDPAKGLVVQDEDNNKYFLYYQNTATSAEIPQVQSTPQSVAQSPVVASPEPAKRVNDISYYIIKPGEPVEGINEEASFTVTEEIVGKMKKSTFNFTVNKETNLNDFFFKEIYLGALPLLGKGGEIEAHVPASLLPKEHLPKNVSDNDIVIFNFKRAPQKSADNVYISKEGDTGLSILEENQRRFPDKKIDMGDFYLKNKAVFAGKHLHTPLPAGTKIYFV